MPIQDLKREIAHAPEQPGVDLFLGRGGATLYVGKATVLRDRLRSYLGAWGASPRLDALLTEGESLEYVVTGSAVMFLRLSPILYVGFKRIVPYKSSVPYPFWDSAIPCSSTGSSYPPT